MNYFSEEEIFEEGSKSTFNNLIDLNNSNLINNLFHEERIPEAIELWRKFNYNKFDGCTIERSYEMMAQITKIKDRDIENLLRRSENEKKIIDESRQKDNDIIELVTEVEKLKYKIAEMEGNSIC